MTESAEKRLIIDLERCDHCEHCGVDCTPCNQPSAGGNGLLGLREKIAFTFICRKCEQASCILACPFDALERQETGAGAGVIVRHNLRCVSCKSCALACPFGTIYEELLPFYTTQCDQCFEDENSLPPCVTTCDQQALEYRPITPGEPGIHILNEHVAARAGPWAREWHKNEVIP